MNQIVIEGFGIGILVALVGIGVFFMLTSPIRKNSGHVAILRKDGTGYESES